MNTRKVLDQATADLEAGGVASPRHDAEVLLSHVTGTPRALLTLTVRLDDVQRRTYLEMIAARARRVPLQHITGTAAFRYVDVEVGPGVFVPRPETEVLAGWAIDASRAVLARDGRDPVVVELCAGSGAISLSVVQEVPESRVHAVELDENAFAWALRNLDGTGVDLRCGDMAEAFADLDGTVDVVVANPPYIPLEAWESVAPEARDHDPSLALWSGQDGLDAMRVLEAVAWRLLVPGGVVGAEHADAQGESAPAVFADRWLDVRDHADLADRPRFVTARRPDRPRGTASGAQGTPLAPSGVGSAPLDVRVAPLESGSARRLRPAEPLKPGREQFHPGVGDARLIDQRADIGCGEGDRPAQRPSGLPHDLVGLRANLEHREACPTHIHRGEKSVSSQVLAVRRRVSMACAVVLRGVVRAADSKIEAGDHHTALVADLRLDVDGNAAERVDESQRRLTGRFAAAIAHHQRLAQVPDAAPPRDQCRADQVDSRVFVPQRRIDRHDEIDEGQGLGEFDDRPFGGRDGDAVEVGAVPFGEGATTDVDASAVVVRCVGVGAHDHGNLVERREPPLAQGGGGQMRRDRSGWHDLERGPGPRGQVVGLGG